MKNTLYAIIVLALILGSIGEGLATNYKQMGKVYPQGNFSSDCFTKIYETTLNATATYLTISNLVGNTTVEYILETRLVANEQIFPVANLNGESTNKGYQELYNSDATTVSAYRAGGGFRFYQVGFTNTTIGQSYTPIYAKSGYARTGITEYIVGVSGTTVTGVSLSGNVWNNSTAEITSIVIDPQVADGLGIGSYICLWGKEYKQ